MRTCAELEERLHYAWISALTSVLSFSLLLFCWNNFGGSGKSRTRVNALRHLHEKAAKWVTMRASERNGRKIYIIPRAPWRVTQIIIITPPLNENRGKLLCGANFNGGKSHLRSQMKKHYQHIFKINNKTATSTPKILQWNKELLMKYKIILQF